MEEQKNENVEKVNNEVKAEVKTENGKGKKSKKGLIIAIIAVVLAIIVGISLFVAYHSSQFALLVSETNKITSMEMLKADGTVDQDAKIDMEIKTKGSYAVVEQTLKEYLNETLETSKKAPEIIKTEDIEKLMSFENIKNDGPEFTQTKAKIAEMRKAGEEYIEQLLSLCEKERFLTVIDDKDISDYYKEIYKKLAVDEETEKELNETKEKGEKAKKQITASFDYIENIFNFLSEHKSDWTIMGNQIMFYNQSVLNQYQQIVSNVPGEIK